MSAPLVSSAKRYRRKMLLLGILVMAIVVTGVVLISQNGPRQTSFVPRASFDNLKGLLPLKDEIPSNYREDTLSYDDNVTLYYEVRSRGNLVLPNVPLGEEIGFQEAVAVRAESCGGFFTERCRSVTFNLYRFSNSSMATSYYDMVISNVTYRGQLSNVTFLPPAGCVLCTTTSHTYYRENWSITGARIFYNEGEAGEESTRALGIGAVSNIVFWVSVSSDHTGWFGDNVKKDIVDMTNLLTEKLV